MRGPWPITDGQVHVWVESTPERPWPAAEISPQRDTAFGVDALLAHMVEASVERAILVPPTWEGPRNDLALAAAVREPDRFGVMGRLDVSRAWTQDELAAWFDAPGMLGARIAFNRTGNAPGNRVGKAAQMEQAESFGFFALAEQIGMPLMLFVPGLVPQVGALARRYPALRIIIDHLSLDEADRGGDLDVLTAPLHGVADIPNIAIKLSALPCFVNDPPGFDRLRPLVQNLVKRFGAERAFWGSDLSRLPCDYGALVDFFADGLPHLNDEERRLVLGGGISRWLRWPDAPTLS